MSDFEKECFLIAPIGDENTPIRKRADGIRDAVVKPAAKAHDLTVVRADEVSEPGLITSQIVEHVVNAKAAVADITDGNANVYYELAARDAAHLPVVLIGEVGTELPFDMKQARTIFFDSTDLSDSLRARDDLEKMLGAALEGKVDNPIASSMRLLQLSEGNPVEMAVAELTERVARLTGYVQMMEERAEERAARTVEETRKYLPPSPTGDYREALARLMAERSTDWPAIAKDIQLPKLSDEQLATLSAAIRRMWEDMQARREGEEPESEDEG